MGEEVVLGGDGVAGNGHGVLFCNHIFFVLNANYRKLYVNLPKICDIWILRDIKI